MAEEGNPLYRFLQGNGVPYYSGWIREGMRRVGVADKLAAHSEPVAAYLSLLAATLSTGTADSNRRRHEAIARFVNSVRGPMGAAVGGIYTGDCAVYYGGFYLERPSSSDLCVVARESYAAANAALSKVSFFPRHFFSVMAENLEGLLEALASVSGDVVKPAVTAEPFLVLSGRRSFNPGVN